jgi:hypothetical protein
VNTRSYEALGDVKTGHSYGKTRQHPLIESVERNPVGAGAVHDEFAKRVSTLAFTCPVAERLAGVKRGPGCVIDAVDELQV